MSSGQLKSYSDSLLDQTTNRSALNQQPDRNDFILSKN